MVEAEDVVEDAKDTTVEDVEDVEEGVVEDAGRRRSTVMDSGQQGEGGGARYSRYDILYISANR